MERGGRPPWLSYGVVILGLHLFGVLALLPGAQMHPILLGMGVLAYSFGLRHAFDTDHIAAIDNTVRALMRRGESPLGAGFYFSLGHSTVVFLMAIAVAAAARWVQEALPYLQVVGGVIGATVSGTFLVLIGLVNLFVWIEIYLIFQDIRQSGHDAGVLEYQLLLRGVVARVAGPLFRLVRRSWQVYPVGFVFGLGFDTASEVALLALSAGAAAAAPSVWSLLALPVLFAAGMSLMDTADGVFMTSAYAWAFVTPLRRVYYNLSVTGLSAVAALFIGITELIQVLARSLGLTAGTRGQVQALDVSLLGYALVVLFVLTWSVSYGVWRLLRLEENGGRF